MPITDLILLVIVKWFIIGLLFFCGLWLWWKVWFMVRSWFYETWVVAQWKINKEQEDDQKENLQNIVVELYKALNITRGQWYHSVNRNQCLKALDAAKEAMKNETR